MGSKLPPRQLELYRAIDQILWKEWDPLGISDAEAWNDEYHAYLPRVFQLALEEKRNEIAEYLHWVQGERMGLESSIESQFSIADKVLQARAQIMAGANDT